MAWLWLLGKGLPRSPGTLPAEDLVLTWQNKAGEQAGAWGYGPEGPSSLLLWATISPPVCQ